MDDGLEPLAAPAYAMRGIAYHDLGNNSAADRDLKKAIELGYTP
jgi:Flp pilus assembly protein TadD